MVTEGSGLKKSTVLEISDSKQHGFGGLRFQTKSMISEVSGFKQKARFCRAPVQNNKHGFGGLRFQTKSTVSEGSESKQKVRFWMSLVSNKKHGFVGLRFQTKSPVSEGSGSNQKARFRRAPLRFQTKSTVLEGSGSRQKKPASQHWIRPYCLNAFSSRILEVRPKLFTTTGRSKNASILSFFFMLSVPLYC